MQRASARCIVFGNPNEDAASRALDELRRRYPDGRELPFPARSGKASVTIFALEAADPGAARSGHGPASSAEAGDAS